MHLSSCSHVNARPRYMPPTKPPTRATGKNSRLTTETRGLGATTHQAVKTASSGQTKTHADCGKNSAYMSPLPDSNQTRAATYHAAGMATARAVSRANRISILQL